MSFAFGTYEAVRADGFDPRKLQSASAADIWNLVDLGDNYDHNYQAYVDFIAFFSRIRTFCTNTGKPAFVVAGNHDCYKNNKLYGISPRVLWKKANEGVPADHNLTFYEAMLVFGETWGKVFGTLFDSKFYEWFYAVFTPFSDFSLALPKLRLVGLAWGEDEEVASWPDSWGQGVTHLGRAEEAVTPDQVALVETGLSPSKKTVLMTHFTLVSYMDDIPFMDGPVAGHIDVGGTGLIRKGDPFSHNDWGTFEKNRAALYGAVANSTTMSCVMTGHSHRKGLYFLGRPDATGFPTEAYGLRTPRDLASLPPETPKRTPIIVSDCGGPLPRYNQNNEFGPWGSDRASGTLVQIGDDGHVTRIESVPTRKAKSKPRLAVAVDYMHVMFGHVFEKIEVSPFERAKATTVQHAITITFHEYFPDQLADGIDVVLFARPSTKDDWIRIPLKRWAKKIKALTLQVPPELSQPFYSWLVTGSKAGRFMSFGFSDAGGLENIYEHNTRWNLEVEAKPSWWNVFHSGSQSYEITPHGDGGGGPVSKLADHIVSPESPNFRWRRQFSPYK
jgi:hypothetical protein